MGAGRVGASVMWQKRAEVVAAREEAVGGRRKPDLQHGLEQRGNGLVTQLGLNLLEVREGVLVLEAREPGE